ncbi:ParA family protein [Floridanema evergladense]|uniref:ParA family protein n=1 Tax=Floridaenema evergladense BLCC-F167 TaxID=3153639 RepID=A0ABV4WRQ1_9CYAN
MPESTKPAKILTVACLSGGSGKTTTVLNLATMLSQTGKTLAVDFDPQGNLSQWLGWADLSEDATIAETILPSSDRVQVEEIIKPPVNEDREGRLMLAPSDYSLSRAADAIAMEPGRERFLKRALKPVLSDYEFIVIDSPPSKGILTYNAILAADYLVIPTECTHKGVMGAVSTVVLVKELLELDFNVPQILGIIPTRDQWAGANQTRMSKAAIEAIKEALPDIHIFSSVRQSTTVQQTNYKGWSLQEAGDESLAQAYIEVINTLMKESSNA